MKLSCNGCRILRKGCNENCILRPCLEWINSSEAQANATLFLAKFYGRTGLLNLLMAAPQHLGPVVFRSLLYEACGRLVNPTYGSLGLFWTGEWAQCEAAVEAVLSGSQINGVAPSNSQTLGTLGGDHILPTCDIRHVPKVKIVDDVRVKAGLKRVGPVVKPKPRVSTVDSTSLRQPNCESKRMRVMEASFVSRDDLNRVGETELNLELTLGFRCQSTSANKTN
ncbi:LOB domain-containing protein 40 [Cajanus cajan]|uniref:LOB domain-containing protein 42 n=1 Tax=Cajanus cajan TaxID=3821 RepID=A0A151RPK3_CAJCA|nr:LOB domain-containing protein 40 [Cajanus cajan]KYP44488.1 LOB domain-containing protein 42 [Cajanus cajan]